MNWSVEENPALAELLRPVQEDDVVTITRDGQAVAVLFPIRTAEPRLSHKEIVEGFRELRNSIKPDSMTIREMIDEGRRY